MREKGEKRVILFNLSGHGHFDLTAYNRYLSGELEDYAFPTEAIEHVRQHIPAIKENALLR